MTSDAYPCTLRRQDCLVGPELARQMMLLGDGQHRKAAIWEAYGHHDTLLAGAVEQPADVAEPPSSEAGQSRFESVFTTHPPILEALLLHLPTRSLLSVYHTSKRLREFFRSYPLAWKNLSFRLPAQERHSLEPSSRSQSPEDGVSPDRVNDLDLLLRVILPFGTLLTRLDLDSTLVSGSELYSRVLDGRRGTLQHLSVRSCKNVSLKYHILPFLQMQAALPKACLDEPPLALKSLYTYRCRHHRRRPYLSSSLHRRDSDSQPTHQLIQACYYLGIWTDTGWCPTPGPRCFRRRDYALGRIAFDSNAEIWVPFDRLWRSQNFIGGSDDTAAHGLGRCSSESSSEPGRPVRLWEQQEYGHHGEPLGAGISSAGEGKELPAHLRKSHTTFVDGFKCHACGEDIQERCEQCSIRMHCVGCRRTLCGSCTFDRPLQAKKREKSHQNTIREALDALGAADVQADIGGDINTRICRRTGTRLWWAPGAIRSPNKINEVSSDEGDAAETGEDTGSDQAGDHPRPLEPRITSEWCCQKLGFSGGGAVSFHGNFNQGTNIRAVPLPMGRGFEDALFPDASERRGPCERPVEVDEVAGQLILEPEPTRRGGGLAFMRPRRTRNVEPYNMTPYLERTVQWGSASYTLTSLPRNLCKPCYNSPKWRVRCAIKDCPNLLCVEHDIKTLQVRQCGLRKLEIERRALSRARPLRSFYAKWKPIAAEMQRYLFTRDSSALTRPSDSDSTGASSSPPSLCLQQPIPNPTACVALRRTVKPPASARAAHRDWPGTRSVSAERPLATTGPTPQAAASNTSARDDSLIAIPRPVEAQSFSDGRDAGARLFTGCSRLFCLPPCSRAPSDVRAECPGWEYLVRCAGCDVYACYDCCGLDMGCGCSACAFGGPRKFLCPGCMGDWEVGERVKRRTEELIAKGESWTAEEREVRFWRCRIAEESKPWVDPADEGKSPGEIEASKREASAELPFLDDDDFDVLGPLEDDSSQGFVDFDL